LSKIIEVLVSPTGETQVETKGFIGNACRDASRFIEQALGIQTTETFKAEFHQVHSAHTSVQHGQS
jgi:hypothetical protein